MARPHVVLLHTGGTLGMRRGERGYEPRAGHLADLLARMPELDRPELPTFTLVEHEPLLDSSDMRPAHWQRLADTLVEHQHGVDGFVVLHGTDTMAYTASALAFLLEGLDRPVVLTGSQVPLAEVRSDARDNLITSLLLATRTDVAEVVVHTGRHLLRGVRATKVSASGFDAFDSPNEPPLGTIGVGIDVDAARLRPPDTGPIRAARLRDAPVLALRLFPGIGAHTLDAVLAAPVEGLVLETYGSGNGPQDDALLEVLARAHARGVVLVNVSQCLRARVRMEEYATGDALARTGLLSGGDMTAEAALAKLLYLLSVERDPERVRRRMAQNLRGERSDAGPVPRQASTP